MSDLITADVVAEVHGRLACITLNRPKALNALSLDMVRTLTLVLRQWQADPEILAVIVKTERVSEEVIEAYLVSAGAGINLHGSQRELARGVAQRLQPPARPQAFSR